MNSVAKQEYYLFLERYFSAVGQGILTNVDTAEQL